MRLHVIGVVRFGPLDPVQLTVEVPGQFPRPVYPPPTTCVRVKGEGSDRVAVGDQVDWHLSALFWYPREAGPTSKAIVLERVGDVYAP